MTLTKSDIIAIKQALQPDFEKIDNKLDKLENKVNKLSKDNRKDHNSIMKYLDERDNRLEKRIVKMENNAGIPSIF